MLIETDELLKKIFEIKGRDLTRVEIVKIIYEIEMNSYKISIDEAIDILADEQTHAKSHFDDTDEELSSFERRYFQALDMAINALTEAKNNEPQ